tara:strand:- start:109 stop:714 length:606 start_codon:yes stop_codon:yes gene_type:complete
MFKHNIYLLCYLFTFLFAETSDNYSKEAEDFTPHISLIIHEDLLNDFFKSMGEIKGSGSGASINYTWHLKNPRIDIKPNEAKFFAKLNAKTDLFSITKDVKGTVDISYIEEDNVIQVVIDKADVILDANLFGNDIVFAEIDIAKYFSKPLRVDGPKSLNNEIDYKLPTGEKKKMSVTTKSYKLKLVEDAIHLITTLDFKTI